MANVLIIDDEMSIRTILSQYASEMSCNVAVAESLKSGFEIASFKDFDLVFLDVRLPDGDGLKELKKFRSLPSEPEVIIITGVDPAKGAEQAIKSGAWDYVHKPFSREEILLHITRALKFRKERTTSKKVSLKKDEIIGRSRELKRCLDQVAQCAGSDVNVLLTGETGTGKELFARAIHQNSPRSDKNFIVVDCASLPEHLMESILCGHKKGSFTGADKDQIGLVKQADQGTLFLDEVGELPLSFQKKFLRILQERSFRPIGSSLEIKSNFRLISATNRNLDSLVQDAKFRKDLIYRLRTFHIQIPALRNRPSDIKDLVQHYILAISEKHGVRLKGYIPEFLDLLVSYNWPGNVRELMNSLERAILTDPENPTLYNMHLPMEIRIHHAKTVSIDKNHSHIVKQDKTSKDAYTDDIPLDFSPLFLSQPLFKEFKEKVNDLGEYQYLEHLMARAKNSVQKACEISQLSQSRLYTLLRKYKLKTK